MHNLITDNQERAREIWIQALESEKYKQGAGHLQFPTGKFCCLGVACEVLGAKYDGGEEYPPQEVVDLLGLVTDHGGCNETQADQLKGKLEVYDYDGSSLELVELNDDVGLTFKEIAGLLRDGYYWRDSKCSLPPS